MPSSNNNSNQNSPRGKKPVVKKEVFADDSIAIWFDLILIFFCFQTTAQVFPASCKMLYAFKVFLKKKKKYKKFVSFNFDFTFF